MNIKNLMPNGITVKTSIIAIIALMLLACGDPESKKMPEEVAQEFVDAIYNSKDIDVIKKNSVSKISGLVDHYRSIKMIQRHVMELTLDSATVKISDVGGDFFRKSKKDTKIELHIRGKYDGGIKADDRFLLMTWESNRWKVKRISKS
jgi:uncharacterized lipoprotein YehR (DUF1307 family)